MEEKVFVLNVNENAARHLYKIARWSKFFAVLGFVVAALLFLGALSMLAFGSIMPFFSHMMPMGGGQGKGILFVVLSLVYVGFGLIYLVISLKLYRFASYVTLALKGNDDELLERGFKNLLSYLRIFGIVTITILSIYFLVFLFAILSGFGSMMMR